jgi:tRNA-uridine 2-sulfurtransferase
MNEEEEKIFANCPWMQDREDARLSAEHLEIPFEVRNMIADYRERVVQYLVSGYGSGLTPNPDMMCNQQIKFGLLMDYALTQGFDGLATGHYVRKCPCDDGSFNLLTGIDTLKDQTYFLAMLKQKQIEHAYFPIGELVKPDVRAIAKEAGLPNANRKDSQGICFLGRVPIGDFLAQYLPDNPGEIVTLDGRVLGLHRGLHRYTLGQRKGMGIPSNSDFEPYVVIRKEMESNRLVVAFDHPETPGLYSSTAKLAGVSWINKAKSGTVRLLARPRYRDPAYPAVVSIDNDQAVVEFDEPQRALAPGQIVALYEGEVLLGGGVLI